MLKSIEKKMSRLHIIISPISLNMILRCLEQNLFANCIQRLNNFESKQNITFNFENTGENTDGQEAFVLLYN